MQRHTNKFFLPVLFVTSLYNNNSTRSFWFFPSSSSVSSCFYHGLRPNLRSNLSPLEHRDKETVVPEGGVCWLLKLQVFVNVLSRMIFPPLRTNIPPLLGGGVLAGWLVSTGLSCVCVCVRPLKTHTGRKYIPNQAENTAGPSFFPLSFSFFFLYTPFHFFYVRTAAALHHHHPGPQQQLPDPRAAV